MAWGRRKPSVGYPLNRDRPLGRPWGGWLFNEGGGAIARDISGNLGHGSITTPDWQFGNLYINTEDNAPAVGTYNFHDRPWTLLIRCKLDSLSNEYVWGVGKNNSMAIRIPSSGQVDLIRRGVSVVASGSAGAVVAGKWVTIGVSLSGSTSRFYIDGALDVEDGSTSDPHSTDAPRAYFIGTDASNVGNGTYEYVLLYDRELTAGEVAESHAHPYDIIHDDESLRKAYKAGGAAPPTATASPLVNTVRIKSLVGGGLIS